MRPLSCLDERSSVLVADTSVAINLNASGCASAILRALPYAMVIVDVVISELESGREKGRKDAELTAALIAAKQLERISLGNLGLRHFEDLVVGLAAETLDDGEAATLAAALERRAVALIDEKKAARIAGERFPNLRLASTLDIFAHATVCAALGPEVLEGAVFRALTEARMQVPKSHIEWVYELIGVEKASMCPSLPRLRRGGMPSG
jgi:predicted nucleic acid-binding protein